MIIEQLLLVVVAVSCVDVPSHARRDMKSLGVSVMRSASGNILVFHSVLLNPMTEHSVPIVRPVTIYF